ncbi:MAG TPA: hypothetical protein VLL48_12990, partial [Longimicrobiales bacterium]|nr:hypothetical protein [Longimicrobiales bacterium]
MMGPVPSSAALALVAASVLAVVPRGAAGQERVIELATACGGASAELEAWCTEVALAAQGTQAAVGLGVTGGNPVPGSASALGRRAGSTPRISVSARGTLSGGRIPEVRSGGAAPAPGEGFTPPGVRFSAAAGLLDGFSIAPTIGGILSLDLLASLSLLSLPDSRGYDGSVGAWGVGARVGLLRESFTLPGVSLSVVRHGVGSVSLGDLAAGDRGRLTVDPTVTSIRAVAGKDLVGLGVQAGIGWDRFGGDAEIEARIPATGTTPALAGSAGTDDFDPSRRVYFGGLSLNLLILQLSAEGGWASGFDAVPGRAAGGF